ncbi:hypothetical protein DAI22_01g175833 [Oryza sativa Japonica Group]|nr:hypothetical protein DAI22_01g175833 [Oryza sativa Japonica Group]
MEILSDFAVQPFLFPARILNFPKFFPSMWARSWAPMAIYRAPSSSSFGRHLSLSPPSPETFSPRAPSLSVAGSRSSRRALPPRSSPLCAATSLGSANPSRWLFCAKSHRR